MGKNHSVKVLTEKKKHQLQILEYAGFSTFNIVTHICDIIKRITGNDERTKQCQAFYDDIKMTGNLWILLIISGIKVSLLNAQDKKFNYLTMNQSNKFKSLDNRSKHLPSRFLILSTCLDMFNSKLMILINKAWSFYLFCCLESNFC